MHLKLKLIFAIKSAKEDETTTRIMKKNTEKKFRIGIYIMLSFLELNRIRIEATNEEVYDLGMKVAEGHADYNEILCWIRGHKK